MGGDVPETYWARLHERLALLTGSDQLQDLRDSRQRATYQTIIDALRRRRAREVLDLGCNRGALGRLLYGQGYRHAYIGVDYNPYALQAALQAMEGIGENALLVRATIRALPFPNQAVECVVMKDVLEHMEDFRPCLSEALRIARRWVVVGAFLPWGEGETVIRQDPRGYYLNRYNRQEVGAFVRQAGWRVVKRVATWETDGRLNEVVMLARPQGATQP